MLLLLPREGPLLFLQNPAPGAPGLLLQGQNTSFSRRRLEISQCPLCWPLHMPHQAFLPAESRKLPHACTVKHINSYSGPKNRLWKTRLGRKRWMFNAQHAWKTRFSLQILNKLCYSFGNTSIPRSILLERRFGLGLKRSVYKGIFPRGISFLLTLYIALSASWFRGKWGKQGQGSFSLLWEISR